MRFFKHKHQIEYLWKEKTDRPIRTKEEVLSWLDGARKRKEAWEKEVDAKFSERSQSKKAAAESVESDDDAAVYRYLCQTDPEGMEMLNEEEQAAFEKKYGL